MAMPLGHGSETQRLRPLARRERLLAGGVAAVSAIVVAVLLVVTLTRPSPRSGHGCIEVSLAYSTGGTQTYRCGPGARAMCSAAMSGQLGGPAGRDVLRECRRAGLGAS